MSLMSCGHDAFTARLRERLIALNLAVTIWTSLSANASGRHYEAT